MGIVDSFPGRKIIVDGQFKIYFGGTSYLGLQTDTNFQNQFIENIKKYGTNYGASRKANIEISIFNKVEQYLANLVESKSCLTVSSGYMAGQLLASFFDKDSVFYAPNTHPAMHQKDAVNFLTFDALERAVTEHIQTQTSTPVVIFDSIDFSGSNYPLFNGIKKLPLDKIILVADDSHGIGLPFNNGKGCFTLLQKLKPKELIVSASLGKGFAIQAGAIFASKKRISSLKETALYGGASPATPASLATILTAKKIYQRKQQRLQRNIDLFIEQCKDLSQFKFMPGHPVFSFRNSKIKELLEVNDIIVTSFNYPKKTSPTMNKIVLSAHHKKKDIELVANLINTLI